jgi:class 3 adenylate cyclase
MDDIRAVYDACRLDRAVLIGVSEGGPLSILFAATYPERVTHLVIYGSYTHGSRSAEERHDLTATITKNWGTGLLDGLIVQHGDETAHAALARYERFACTPMMAADKNRADAALDVRAVLPAVNVPTLVLHNRDDPFMGIDASREIAAGIPDARFVELPGDFHASWRPHDYDQLVAEIEEFVTGTHTADVFVDRVLTTVLFSDIVDSTRRAGELGDHRWRELLDAHDRLVRAELARRRGREINTTGDGFFAAFDGPGRAISCAVAMARAAETLGLQLRVGVHTGECEVRGDDLAGIAVHIGARLAHLAAPGEILVTSTVRDLIAGSGIEFSDHGTHSLKGVPGTWNVLAVEATSISGAAKPSG